MKMINLTPHAIHIYVGDEIVQTISPEATLARCSMKTDVRGSVVVNGVEIPLTASVLGDLQGLPEPQEDTLFITSLLAATKAWEIGRTDVVVPTDAVRDSENRVVGCRAFGIRP